MTKFFYELTKRNWGWPYHLFLAALGSQFIFGIYFLIFEVVRMEHFLFMWYAVLTFFTINAIGIAYEIYQAKTNPADKKGSLEDYLGNITGSIIGIAMMSFAQWVFSYA